MAGAAGGDGGPADPAAREAMIVWLVYCPDDFSIVGIAETERVAKDLAVADNSGKEIAWKPKVDGFYAGQIDYPEYRITRLEVKR